MNISLSALKEALVIELLALSARRHRPGKAPLRQSLSVAQRLPALERRKAYVFVAIDRPTRWVYACPRNSPIWARASKFTSIKGCVASAFVDH
jgi:hypothetical protein